MSEAWRDDPDFRSEPIPGLPERLPRGESILWQGRPRVWALARSTLALDWIAGYFVLLALWRVGSLWSGMGWAALPMALPFLGLGLVACGLILLVAWAQARATLYTITTARVAMRVGAALTLTLNLPFQKITRADLGRGANGTGIIALSPVEEAQLSYMLLWPHVRPWHLRHPQPALRCIPDAERVAALLAEAVEMRAERPEVAPAVMAAE